MLCYIMFILFVVFVLFMRTVIWWYYMCVVNLIAGKSQFYLFLYRTEFCQVLNIVMTCVHVVDLPACIFLSLFFFLVVLSHIVDCLIFDS